MVRVMIAWLGIGPARDLWEGASARTHLTGMGGIKAGPQRRVNSGIMHKPFTVKVGALGFEPRTGRV